MNSGPLMLAGTFSIFHPTKFDVAVGNGYFSAGRRKLQQSRETKSHNVSDERLGGGRAPVAGEKAALTAFPKRRKLLFPLFSLAWHEK